MTAKNNKTARKSVEQRWREVFVEHGAGEEKADRLVGALQAHPELALGAPSAERVRTLIIKAIQQLDLTSVGPAADSREAEVIRIELEQILDRGIDNELQGPVSIEETRDPTVDDPGPEGQITPGAPSKPATQPASESARGFAYESPDVDTESSSEQGNDEHRDADTVAAGDEEEMSEVQAREQIREALGVLSTEELRTLLEEELNRRHDNE